MSLGCSCSLVMASSRRSGPGPEKEGGIFVRETKRIIRGIEWDVRKKGAEPRCLLCTSTIVLP